MSLKDRIQQDMQAALRAGDKARLSVLRMALAGIKQREVDTRRPLDDAGVQSVIERMIKQGRDSASQYRDGSRQDLVDKEEAEIRVLQTYLPQPLSESELDSLIAEAVEAAGAMSVKDLGKVMAVIKTRAAGRVDMGEASARVRAVLAAE
jgi:uncharacterized protein YqeY